MIASLLVALAAAPVPIYSSTVRERAPADPCAAIAGQTWVAPSAARACLNSFAFNETIRTNLVDNVSKTLNFHTSVTYTLHLPPPFAEDSTDIQGRLAQIRKKHYKTDFELHNDISLAVRSLNDGHAAYLNYCYDGIYSTYLPFPLVNYGEDIHIAPEAYEVATAEFGADAIAEWEKEAKIKLAKYSGARVLLINGLPPWFAVDQEAAVAGSYQTKATRENGYFSSYQAAAAGWTYRLGGFAQQTLPIKDTVTLTVIPANATSIFPETFTIPYRSRIGSATKPFTDGPSFWANNCQPRADTNGASYYPDSSSAQRKQPGEAGRPRYTEPTVIRVGGKLQPVSALVDATAASDVVLPPRLQPGQPTSGSGSMQFFLLDDKVTGVLALGSFSGDYNGLYDGLLAGINDLKSRGATRLIVDVTNNGGGYICIAAWLHRILAGPAPGTTPEPGLDSQARAGDLAQKIVKKIAAGGDPQTLTLYNGQNWRNGDSSRFFNATEDWLDPARDVVINGVKDRFSQRLGDICLPFERTPPDVAPFPPQNIVLVGNGRCASSCSLFSINMHIKHGVKTAVVGGRKSATQQYCGIVGGQSLGYADIDSDIKSVGLKSDPLAPPDFIVDAYQGLTWRLGWSILHPDQPEEFQSHPADFNIPLDATLSNNPTAIWKRVAQAAWSK